MVSITFRFMTECEITLKACSHQEAYLQFKDLYHHGKPFHLRASSSSYPSQHIYPPLHNAILFEIDEQNQFNTMTMQGSYSQDILANLPDNWLRRIDASSNKRATKLEVTPH